MDRRHVNGWSRREFLELTLAGTVGLLGLKPELTAAEPPPETTRLRLVQSPSDLCQAPKFVAEPLLRDEGFTEVHYVKKDRPLGSVEALATAEADINMDFVPDAVIQLDGGAPIVILAGGHIGCFELFGTDQVRSVRDLKGKTVAVPDLQTGPINFIASIAAYVGLDTSKDIYWVTRPPAEAMQLLGAGKIDAFMIYPPEQQEFRTQHVGHVLVNGTLDRP
jgi:NitT/TauT family transport system substrate-binding protein